jgi:hypothetical protein
MPDEQTTEPAAQPVVADDRADGCGECPVKALGGSIKLMESLLKDLVPEEFWQHRRAARRETLLAVRSLVDAAIERVDKEPEQQKRHSATKIPIA